MKIQFLTAFVLMMQFAFAQTEKIDTKDEKGTIVNGEKEGIWEYFDEPGEIALKVDYNSGVLIYLKPDTSEYVIKTEEGWTKQKLDKPPRFIGSMNGFYKGIKDQVIYPTIARENNTVGTFYIVFEIGTTGEINNYAVLSDIGDDCSDEAIKALKNISSYWLPAEKNKKNYPSKFILPFTFKIERNGQEVQSKQKKKKEDLKLPLANRLDEIVIQTKDVLRTK